VTAQRCCRSGPNTTHDSNIVGPVFFGYKLGTGNATFSKILNNVNRLIVMINSVYKVAKLAKDFLSYNAVD